MKILDLLGILVILEGVDIVLYGVYDILHYVIFGK